MLYYLEYLLVLGVTALANLLPLSFSHCLARSIGDLSYLVMVKRRKVAVDNLSRVYGDLLSLKEKKAIVRRSFEHAALSITELFTVSSILQDASERFSFEGTSNLDAAFQKGKGIILVISHVGAWEYLAFLPFLRKYPCSVVVKTLKNIRIDSMMNRFRQMTSLCPIPKKNAAKKILYEIRRNHLVAILIDQWAGDEGIWTDFFSVGTSTTSIPARLAERTGCALVPAYCLRVGNGQYEIHIEKALDRDTYDPESEYHVTEKLNRVLERQIREYPEQWLWGHRRWKSKRSRQDHRFGIEHHE